MPPRALAPLIDFAFPPRCPSCGDAIAGGNEGGDDALCAACWSDLEIPGSPACSACQRPFGADHLGDDALCAPCLVDAPRHDGIAAATIYGPISRAMVLALKHGGKIVMARRMGRMMAARLPDLPNDTLVVPVPLHRWRLWKRGYNQAVLLGAAIAGAKDYTMHPDLLRRVRATPSLGGLNPAARRRALQGAIAPDRRCGEVAGRTVLLVDDVVTSGATSDRCTAALKKAGASRVVVSCFARVIEGDRVPEMKTPGVA